MSAISFTADGKDYKLEVTASTLKQMEKSGVNFAQLGDKLLGIETLWKGLFIAHHNSVSDAKRMEIYHSLSQTEEGAEPEYNEDGEPVDMLMRAIIELYDEAITSLKRGHGKQGNATWKMT